MAMELMVVLLLTLNGWQDFFCVLAFPSIVFLGILNECCGVVAAIPSVLVAVGLMFLIANLQFRETESNNRVLILEWLAAEL